MTSALWRQLALGISTSCCLRGIITELIKYQQPVVRGEWLIFNAIHLINPVNCFSGINAVSNLGCGITSAVSAVLRADTQEK
jgi:hypothetical protein